MQRTAPDSDEQQRRFFDIAIAMLGLVIFSPLLALIAVLIKTESPGPVLFAQRRIGKRSKPFEMLKFRSMRVASAEGDTAVTNAEDIDAFVFRPVGQKTAIGRALRACSLDEMPNLLNVLRGDIHLVGPRPDEPELVALYRPEWQKRHDVKPGITGLAQINLPPDSDLDSVRRKLAVDLYYIEHGCVWLDLRILGCTFARLFGIKGAYASRLFGLYDCMSKDVCMENDTSHDFCTSEFPRKASDLHEAPRRVLRRDPC